MEPLLIIALVVVAMVLGAVARHVGGPSIDRFVNINPGRSDYPIATSQRASELGETGGVEVRQERDR